MCPHNQFSWLRLRQGVARRVDPPSGLLGAARLPFAHPGLAPTFQLFPDFLLVRSPVSAFGEGQVSVLSVTRCSALGLAHRKQLISTNKWVSELLCHKTQRLTALQN